MEYIIYYKRPDGYSNVLMASNKSELIQIIESLEEGSTIKIFTV